jgi:hypothetical protein
VIFGDVVPGQKWTGLKSLLDAWDGWKGYEYIWLPDDDIAMSSYEINEFFSLCVEHDAAIAAPALTQDSPASHILSLKNLSFKWRKLTFVEIMMPCFKSSALRDLVHTLSYSATGFGWGLDLMWAQAINYNNMFVFDCVEVTHTRPVGRMRDPAMESAAWGELRASIDATNNMQIVKVIAGLLNDGRLVEESHHIFYPALISGYNYAFDRNPEWFGQMMYRQGWIKT